MRGFKMMFGLGVALVLGLAGIGQARVETPSGFLPLDWPESVGSAMRTIPGVGSATRTIPDPGQERSAQRTLHESPERLTFTSGGHVLRFAPDHLLTAGATHALKVEFVGANQTVPQSDTPAGDNPVGSARRTIPDPSSEWSAQRTLQDSPRPLGEGLGVRAEGTQGFRSFPRSSLGTGVAKSRLPGDLDQPELAEQGSQAGAWEPAKPAENHVGSATRTIPDPSSEWSAQRTLHNPPRPAGEGLGVRVTDRSRQNPQAPPLTQVHYPNLWQGIDLSYRAAPGGIAESVYQLQPGADIGQVRLRYNRPLSLDAEGRLNIRFDSGLLTESAPIAWQEIEGQRQAVSVAFVQHGEQELGFRLGDHDPSRALWIDPTLAWNTFLGGGNSAGLAIAINSNGNTYLAGWSDSWGNPIRAFSGSGDAFVAKLNPNGVLLWNTFLGGSDADQAEAITVDKSGRIYVAGYSRTTWGSPLRPYSGRADAFVAKLDSNGVLLWNTFLGGSDQDYGYGIALDSNSHIYLGGYSRTTWGNPQRAYTASYDAFIAKLDTNGNLLWNTFLGGNVYDEGSSIAVDVSGNCVLTGESRATWGSPIRAYQGGTHDSFVAKVDPNGTLLWNTFLGGTSDETGQGITLDGSGNVYVIGASDTSWGSPRRAYSDINGFDAYVAKLNTNGLLLWNSFLGGKSDDYGEGIVVDSNGDVYVTGRSYGTWGAPQRAYSGEGDVFIVKLDTNGTLLWNSFLGSNRLDEGYGITLDSKGSLYVSGYALDPWGTPVRAHGGGSADAFVAKLSGEGAAPISVLDQAMDTDSLHWTTSPAAPWSGQTTVSRVGGDAAQSGVIGDSQASSLSTEVDGPGWVRFWWKVSSESGFDFLRFYLDTVLQQGISGEIDWRQPAFWIGPGSHHLTWAYEKDDSLKTGTDAAWVDALEIEQWSGITLSLGYLDGATYVLGPINNGWIRSVPAGIDCRRQGGVVEGVCRADFAPGTQVTLAPVDDGHSFSAWQGACGGADDAPNPTPSCTLALIGNTGVTAKFAASALMPTPQAIGDTGAHPSLSLATIGKGQVNVTLPNGAVQLSGCRSDSAPGNCYKSWPGVLAVSIQAVPDVGQAFERWEGDCQGTESQCTLEVRGAKSVSARFKTLEAPTASLVVQKTGNGTVSGGLINCGNQCAASLAKGTALNLSTSPAGGYSFNGWSGDCSGSSCQVNMNGPKTVTANFVPTTGTSYLLTLTKPSHGSVRSPGGDLLCGNQGNACTKSYPSGTELILEAIAESGYLHNSWAGCQSGEKSNNCRVKLDSAKMVEASFVAIPPVTYQLLLSAESGGSLSVAGKGSCSAGQSCNYAYTGTSPPTQASLTATPDSGYRFNGWSGDCAGQGNPCTLAMSQNRNTTASFAVNSGGTAPPRLQVYTSGNGAVSGPGINCGADCSETYSLNQSIQLTASTQGGTRFGGWGGACSGTNATCNLQMGYDKSVTAQFIDDSTNTRILGVDVSGLGTVTTDENPPKIDCRTSGCQASYDSWQLAKLYAEPDPGKSFLGWGGNCAGWGTGDICVLNMSSNQQVSANFTPAPVNYSLTVNKSGSGTVSGPGINCGADCSESYSSGTSVTLNATPATGWQFSGWSGDCSGQGACNLNMTAAKNVTATFSQIPVSNYSLTVNKSGSGTVSGPGINCGADCSESYSSGTAVTLNATPATGWQFNGWSGDCSGQGACNLNMTAAKNVTATFSQIPVSNYSLTVNKSGSGTVSGPGINCGADCTESYSSGTAVTLNATPASGWQFSGWSGDCSGQGACNLTMTAAKNVTATFSQIPVNNYSLTVNKSGSGTVNGPGINCGADCTESYSSGTAVTLNATPATGWQFSGWSGDCSGQGACNLNMTAAKNVTANFYSQGGGPNPNPNPNPNPSLRVGTDTDGDGKADILWRNIATGENWRYRMNGHNIQESQPINTVSNLNWKIAGIGDFNGDGKADILWRNSSTGENWLYRMNGNSLQGSDPINAVSNLDWKVAGVGDFDGDGKADILWRNSATGENWLYRMNGNSIQGSNPVNTVSNLDWKIVGVGDTDGDGKADILWRNSATGENWLYRMNGNSIQGSHPINTVSNLSWKIAGVGDFDGDGKADILWRNIATGENWLYLMNGNSIQGSNPINTVSNLNWKIVLLGDCDGDGKADILWRNSSTGENWLYRMNGNSVQGSNPINTVADQNWQIQGGGGN